MNDSETKEYYEKETVLFELDKLGFYGSDITLEIALFEYHLICASDKHFRNYSFIYGTEFNAINEPIKFDKCSLTIKEINSLCFDSFVNINDILNFIGMTQKEFNKQTGFQKIFDLVSYYGYQEIFGSCYYPISIKELI